MQPLGLTAYAILILATIDSGLVQSPALTIELKTDNERSRQTREQLEQLVKRYDLDPYIHTRRILIEQGVIPHSHPVLTLNTSHLGDDLMLLSSFLHEQLHWLVSDRDSTREGAIADFREIYPEVPVGEGEGARSEYSTYLHLIVCGLEYQAMTNVVGARKARETLARIDHYRWIYDKVLNDPEVGRINAKWGFVAD